MSDQTDEPQSPEAEAGGTLAQVQDEPLGVDLAHPGDEARHPVRQRFLLPLLLPVGAILVVAFFVLNISRVLLFAGKDASVVVGIILTLGILISAILVSRSVRSRSGPMYVLGACVAVVVLLAGTVTLGPAAPHNDSGSTGFVEPTGPAVATVEIDALPTLKFQAKEFPTVAGINDIKYIGKGGTHTLVFADPKFAGFELKVGPPDQDSAKVDLPDGKYEIYCSIPGHKQAGMDGYIVVSGSAAGGATGASGASGATGASGSAG